MAATVLSVTRPRPRSESSVKLTVVLSTAPTFMPATKSQWRVMPSGSRGSPGAAKSTANADPVTVDASTLSTGSPPSTSPLSFASRTRRTFSRVAAGFAVPPNRPTRRRTDTVSGLAAVASTRSRTAFGPPSPAIGDTRLPPEAAATLPINWTTTALPVTRPPDRLTAAPSLTRWAVTPLDPSNDRRKVSPCLGVPFRS